jgi:hypothetical protein
LLFPSRHSTIDGLPAVRTIPRNLRRSAVLLFALSIVCSTSPAPFCTLPAACLAKPFACWVEKIAATKREQHVAEDDPRRIIVVRFGADYSQRAPTDSQLSKSEKSEHR